MLRSDLTSAFMLLTRLPVGRFAPPREAPDPGRGVWAFPVVGLAVGLAAGLCYWVTVSLGIPPLLSAVWTLVATLAMTGGLHEDGLADTADGFGGGATAARKLEIMRDSRIGSYGTLALLLSILIRIAAIADIGRPAAVITDLVLAGMLGRSAMVVLLVWLPAARPDGMGAAMGRPRATSAMLALAIASVAPFFWLPAGPALLIVGVAAGGALAVTRLAAAQIDGYTGDVLGAAEIVAECAVLTVLAGTVGE